MFGHLNLALARILKLDEELRKGSFLNQKQLAEKFDVSRRTMQRDFDLLREHNAPIKYDGKRRGYCYSDPSFRLSFLKISARELVAVFLAQRLLDAYGDTPFGQGIADLFRRCLSLLDGDIHFDAGQLRSCLAVRLARVPAADAALFARLSEATQRRHRLRLYYWTAERGELSQRMVDPYALVCGQGDWLLVGWCHARRAVRTFAVHRIRDLEETEEAFEPAPDFDLDVYLSQAFTKVRGDGAPRTVRLRFEPTAARYVGERQWHPTQVWQELPDGGGRLTLRLASFVEIKAFALSWGARCVVEEPEELRAEIAAELGRMTGGYSKAAHQRRFATSRRKRRVRGKKA